MGHKRSFGGQVTPAQVVNQPLTLPRHDTAMSRGRPHAPSKLMPGPLSNHRWEAFCQAYATGLSAFDAYASVYNGSGASQSAYKLLRNPQIQARIAELTGHAAASADVSREDLIRMAQDLHAAAFRDKAYGPAASALKELGVLTGHRIERRDVDMTASVTGIISERPMPQHEFERRYLIPPDDADLNYDGTPLN
jgi:hypothetical protein